MHYYKRNLGDYAKKAGRLTMLQHGAYTLLIDSCYDREVFPTLEQALEWTWASSEAEIDAVKFVLSRFFVLNQDGQYVQDRILEELLQYHKTADTNKRIAAERETKRKEISTKRERSVNEPPPNHKPRTKNQEPITNKPVKTTAPMPHGIDARIWVDWIALRKSKKAAVTETAIKGIEREAAKAGMTLEQVLVTCCERGWAGFKAEWVQDKRISKAQQQQDRMLNVALEWLQESK
jgi:uncharacterized protein YdaU (DUF1376 family)